jgi:probable addiction module antidote protein
MTEKFSRYDSADYLKTDEDIALYFETCLEENDPALIAHALGVIARAKGMTQLAPDTGLAKVPLV